VLRTDVDGLSAGSLGELAVFSPRKLLPIPDGGILVVNQEMGGSWPEISITKQSAAIRDTMGLLKKKVRGCLEGVAGSLTSDPSRTMDRDLFGVHDFREETYDQGMSPISRHLLDRFDFGKIITIRRQNYSLLENLLNGVSGLRSLMGPLPAKTCPWLFLAVVNDPLDLHRRLLGRKIKSIVFWGYFHERFPMGRMKDAEHLKKHVLALPIHQDLNQDHIEYIAHAVRSYFAGKG
jgi:hypothetical protein